MSKLCKFMVPCAGPDFSINEGQVLALEDEVAERYAVSGACVILADVAEPVEEAAPKVEPLEPVIKPENEKEDE